MLKQLQNVIRMFSLKTHSIHKSVNLGIANDVQDLFLDNLNDFPKKKSLVIHNRYLQRHTRSQETNPK